jgi:hypothetical protein
MKRSLPFALAAILLLYMAATAQTPTNPNLALGDDTTATASSVYVNSDFNPSGAIDGDRKGVAWGNNGGWNDNTQNSFPDWLQVNLGREYLVGCAVLVTLQDDFNNPVEPTPTQTCANYGVTEFDVEVPSSGSGFTVVASVLFTNFKCVNVVSFTPVRADTFRFTIKEAEGGYSRIVEAELYRTCPTS